MSSNQNALILFPVGRLIGGSMTEGRTKKQDGTPITNKDGTPATDWSFGVAYAKGAETHWNQTPWGAVIWNAAVAGFPQGQYQQPAFSWKVTDGDSQIPNKNLKKPCDQEGYKGHWVVWFSSRFAPRTVDAKGTSAIDPALIKPGYFVQVYADVSDNKPAQSPGMYVNHRFVSLQGFGPEIQYGPDASAVGFGQAALPAGASAVPVGMTTAPAGAVPVPGAATAPPPPAAQVATTPDPSVLAAGTTAPPPPPAAAAAPPPPPPAARTKQDRMQNGQNYDQCIAAGWSDETLIQHGHMLPA